MTGSELLPDVPSPVPVASDLYTPGMPSGLFLPLHTVLAAPGLITSDSKTLSAWFDPKHERIHTNQQLLGVGMVTPGYESILDSGDNRRRRLDWMLEFRLHICRTKSQQEMMESDGGQSLPRCLLHFLHPICYYLSDAENGNQPHPDPMNSWFCQGWPQLSVQLSSGPVRSCLSPWKNPCHTPHHNWQNYFSGMRNMIPRILPLIPRHQLIHSHLYHHNHYRHPHHHHRNWIPALPLYHMSWIFVWRCG